MGPIRVLITDDHPATREGLRLAIDREADMEVVGEADDGAACVDMHARLLPDVTLLDLQMPGYDGLHAITKIREQQHDAAIVVLTTFEGDGRVARALSLGAISYLLKSSTLEEIVRAVRNARLGRRMMTQQVVKDMAHYTVLGQLTPREVHVLKLVAQGKSNRVIAEELFVSEDTVKSRMRRILDKLQARDRAHAVKLGIERGYIDG